MDVLSTALLWLVIGLAVAAALVLRSDEASPLARLGLFGGAVLFWPLFAPTLLGARTAAPPKPPPGSPLLARIAATEAQLLAALGKVEGLAGEALAPEVARIRGLAKALLAVERRASELSALLETPEFDAAAARRLLDDLAARGHGDADVRVQSVKARLRNVDRLRAMRDRAAEDLERVLLQLEEMSTRLLLVQLAPRPGEEAARLVGEIARTVESVSDGLLAGAEAAS